MANIVCPGCGLSLDSSEQEPDTIFHASRACLQLYWEVSAFTLTLADPSFIHQLAVDSYAAQHSGPETKPVRTAFALMGLCLTFERGYSGREVQLAHMAMGKAHTSWPVFNPPEVKNMLTVFDVLRADLPLNYKGLINKWGASAWDYWKPEHSKVKRLLATYLDACK